MKLRAARLGCLNVREHQAKDIDVRVGRCECAKEVRGQIRFKFVRFVRGQSAALDPCVPGRTPPFLEECRIILRALNKEPAYVLNTMRSNGLQDAVLGNTVAGGVKILDGIASAGMQQSVAATGCAICDVSLLQQRGGDAPQAQVPKNAGARRTATDDDNLCRFHFFSPRVDCWHFGTRMIGLLHTDMRLCALELTHPPNGLFRNFNLMEKTGYGQERNAVAESPNPSAGH